MDEINECWVSCCSLSPFPPDSDFLAAAPFSCPDHGAGSFASAEFVMRGYSQKMTCKKGYRQFLLAVCKTAPFSETLQCLISRHVLATLGLKRRRQNLWGGWFGVCLGISWPAITLQGGSSRFPTPPWVGASVQSSLCVLLVLLWSSCLPSRRSHRLW